LSRVIQLHNIISCFFFMFQRWQRRWFVLFDDGELIYSLDEHVSVLYLKQNVWAHCAFLFIMVSIWSATAGEFVGIVGVTLLVSCIYRHTMPSELTPAANIQDHINTELSPNITRFFSLVDLKKKILLNKLIFNNYQNVNI